MGASARGRRGLRTLAILLVLGGGLVIARPVGAPHAVAAEPCADWTMYGATPARTFEAPCPSPIDATTVARLAPAWVFDTNKPVTASPAVVDGVVYVGSWEPAMHALDAETGAVLWEHEVAPAPGAAFGPIVSSAAVVDTEVDSAPVRLVLFGAGPRVVALDASDGSEVWVHDASAGVADTPTEYESSPVVVDDRVLIGRDTHNQGTDDTGGVRGGLVALDLATGAVDWTFEPELDQPGEGCGGVWGSPTVDTATDLVYVGTANCPADGYEWTPHVNAVTAVDLATGSPVWAFQPTGPPDDDTDFGATPNLFLDADGRKVLGAGKKDGTYYALDPASGDLLWSTHVADPAPNVGGFIGSPAVYDGNVFGGTAIGSPPYFHSLDGATGAVRFQGGGGPSYGATAVVNGVAFNAALDDLLKAYDAETGLLLWSSPLSGPGSSGPAIAGDMVFVGAGTTTADACPGDDELCTLIFDDVLGDLGGVHAFHLLGPGEATTAVEPPDELQPPAGDGPEIVLSGEADRLNAYDAVTGEKHTVIPSSDDDPEHGLDINAEICFVPDGVAWKPDGERWFIAGEDTEQNTEPGVIKQGWGIFRLEGTTLETLRATQLGKLVPDSFVTETSNPENYGCGILPDGRVVTGDVGDQFPQDPATGQLIEWFITADHLQHVGPDRNDFARVPHCKIDVSIGTAGGIEVDGTDVLIASNRPDLEALERGGVYRYDTTVWPTGESAEAGCGRADATGEQLADEDKVGRSLFIPQTPGLLTTPSDIVDSGRGTFFVSSVFTGQVAEYDRNGVFQRFVVATTGQAGGITPFGIGVGRDGTLWVADIGIIGPGPFPDAGSVVRVRFDEADQPQALETIDEGLQFPDGIGLVSLPAPGGDGADTTDDDGGRTSGGRLPATGTPAPASALLLLVAAMGVGAGRLARAARGGPQP